MWRLEFYSSISAKSIAFSSSIPAPGHTTPGSLLPNLQEPGSWESCSCSCSCCCSVFSYEQLVWFVPPTSSRRALKLTSGRNGALQIFEFCQMLALYYKLMLVVALSCPTASPGIYGLSRRWQLYCQLLLHLSYSWVSSPEGAGSCSSGQERLAELHVEIVEHLAP